METFAEEELSAGSLVSKTTEVLAHFAELLGGANDDGQWSRIRWESSRNSASIEKAADDEDDSVCDFSSFPSLSLQKKGYADERNACPQSKDDVAGYCAALLSRPILVSNAACNLQECEEEDEDYFTTESVSQVPEVMKRNLVATFSTLVQSRLRAYATFLARHGLALSESAEANSKDRQGRVVGVEQKLETMLEIGNLLALDKVSVTFQAQRERATSVDDGDDDLKVFMPLRMKASLSVFFPDVKNEPKELHMPFGAAGNLTGK